MFPFCATKILQFCSNYQLDYVVSKRLCNLGLAYSQLNTVN